MSTASKPIRRRPATWPSPQNSLHRAVPALWQQAAAKWDAGGLCSDRGRARDGRGTCAVASTICARISGSRA